MSDKWTIQGKAFANCNCAWGCPCQFGSPTTHGHCEGVGAGTIERGHFNETELNGLNWVMLLQWPGEIADGNGTQQAIIDQRADPEQREALRKILHGEATTPGTTAFFVYNSTMSKVLDPIFAPIEFSIDVEARQARLQVADLLESEGRPITHPVSGKEHRARIHLPNGFEYTYAEMGSGTSKCRAGIQLDLKDSYGQFSVMHMNQDGIIR